MYLNSQGKKIEEGLIKDRKPRAGNKMASFLSEMRH